MSAGRYPNIAAVVYGQPWMMLPERYQEMCAAFERVRAMGLPELAADDPEGPEIVDWNGKRNPIQNQVEVMGHVALLQVHGVMGKGLSRLSLQCGGFDTGVMVRQMGNVLDDEKIKTLVLDFSTPGGTVQGTKLAADAIAAVRASGKKVIGYTEKLCCSAGYWLASQCDHFYASEDAMVGSISTILTGVDSSKAWEKEGLELKLFSTGKFKATGVPGKAWTKEEEDNLWRICRGMDAEFKGAVKAGRGLRDEDMEGQWWEAKSAPQGVVDGTQFRTLDEVLEAAFLL